MPRDLILKYMKGLDRCLEELLRQDIEDIAGIIFDAYKKGKRIFIMGNGGSASTASHFARDLAIGTITDNRLCLRAMSLTDNMVVITSLANDRGYDYIFEQQLVGQIKEGDVVIAISASGNSPNILKAIEYACLEGVLTIGFIGFGGGKLKELTYKSIVLSSKDYGQVEDAHLCLAHIISCLVKEKITDD